MGLISRVPEDRVRSDLLANRAFARGYGCILVLPLFH